MGASIKEEHRLKGVDDYAIWKRKVQAALGEEGLTSHVFKDWSTLQQEVEEDYPAPTGATPTERSRLKTALRKLENDATIAFSIIYNGLSKTAQNKLPDDKSSFETPNPKGLYEHLGDKYGASSGTRQAELWSAIFGPEILKNENPEPVITDIWRAGAEIIAAAGPNMSLQDFANSVLAYAAIRRLPPSYGLLASTFIGSKKNITLETVLERVSAEHRRRENHGQTVNKHGLLAKQGAQRRGDPAGRGSQAHRGDRGKKGGIQNPWGGDREAGDKWCEHHKVKSHNTSKCKGLKAGWLSPEEFKKKKELEKKEKGLEAEQGRELGKDSETEGASIAMAFHALEMALKASVGRNKIILDSGATSPFIKDKHLLHNLVPLSRPVSFRCGAVNRGLREGSGRVKVMHAG